MMSQTGIHILPNISRSKGNQATKFGQLIGYNMRTIFLEILCKKYGGELVLDTSKLGIYLNQQPEI